MTTTTTRTQAQREENAAALRKQNAKQAAIAKDSAALAEAVSKPEPRTAAKPTTTPAGLKAPAKPAAKAPAKKVAKPAAKPALKAEPKVKKVPESRNLPRLLVETVAAAFADYSAEDQQRVANYLKIVTTGTDEAGHRWWVDEAYPNFPRPTHFSWNA
jgi:hypothetical protein